MTHLLFTRPRRLTQPFLIMLTGAMLTALIALTHAFASPGQEKAGSQVVKDATVGHTAFTYQGQLKDASGPVNGAYDLQFTLYSTQTGGEKLNSMSIENLVLTNGLFNVQLDVGRTIAETKEGWLEIGVRPSGSLEPYTVLFPRQKLTPTPYAIFAQQAPWSLIGVPVGVPGRVMNETVAIDTIVTQAVNSDHPADEQKVKVHQSIKDDIPAVETKSAAAPAGVEWTRDGQGNLYPTIIGDNVGIGTTGPVGKLQVVTANDTNPQITFAWDSRHFVIGGAGSSGSIGMSYDQTNNVGYIGALSPSVAWRNLVLQSGGGNVGIGTTLPTERLTVGGGSLADTKIEINAGGNQYAALRLKNSAGSWDWQVTPSADAPGGRLRLTDETTGNEFLAITHAGNVGIGTANPVNGKLEVQSNFVGGFFTATNANVGTGVIGRALTTSGNGVGVSGSAPGGKGVVGSSDTGSGVYGFSQTGVGVYGVSSRFEGVRGEASDVNHGGVVGVHNGGGVAIYGTSRGTGVVGDSTSAGGYGGYFRNTAGGVALQIEGMARVSVLQIMGGSDLAEPFEMTHAESLRPGLVVAIDAERPGHLRIADKAYDRTVAGILSGANGINPGLTLTQQGSAADGSHPVALTGRVYCWADASYGSIEPGDLLTTSATPGHAMKVTNHKKAQGAIIGKAMTSLKQGKGLVLVLVTLQ